MKYQCEYFVAGNPEQLAADINGFFHEQEKNGIDVGFRDIQYIQHIQPDPFKPGMAKVIFQAYLIWKPTVV